MVHDNTLAIVQRLCIVQ